MVKEEYIISTDNGGKYLIVKEIDEDEKGKYFFAVGITDDYEIDYENIIIFRAEKKGEQEIVTALDENTDEYQELMATYYVKIACEYIPGARKKAEEIIKQLEEESSE